jgi:phenylacetate-CoA ligase
LTDKSELSRFNHDFLAAAEEKIVDICQTSGTTGDAVTFWQTEADLQRLAKNEQLAFTAAGIKVTDRVLIGAALDRVFMAGLAYFLGLRRIGATAIRAGSGQPALIAELILQQHPNVLVGVPSLLLMVAHQLQQRSEEPATWGIEKIICIGEPVRNEDLTLSPLGQALNDKWSAQIFGTYASTEMATAFTDCCNGCGGHLLSELIIVEILNNAGDPVAVGETGEIVVTPLGIEGTPLLRYRTGDITAILSRETCKCGRTMLRIKRIKGRTDDMIVIKGVNFYPKQIESLIMGLEGAYGQYQIVLKKIEGKDYMLLQVEYEGERPEEFKERLHKKIYDFLGFSVDIEILSVGSLPRQPGKAVRVIDERNK